MMFLACFGIISAVQKRKKCGTEKLKLRSALDRDTETPCDMAFNETDTKTLNIFFSVVLLKTLRVGNKDTKGRTCETTLPSTPFLSGFAFHELKRQFFVVNARTCLNCVKFFPVTHPEEFDKKM